LAINIPKQKRTPGMILEDKVNGIALADLIDAIIYHISELDDDEDDRKGLVELILLDLVNARIKYKVNTRDELPLITTDETWLLYNDIYNGLEGGRFAMWYKDAEAVYKIASIPGNYLEIGTAHGGSAIMATKAKREGSIYCVDPLESSFSMVKKSFAKFDAPLPNFIRKMTPPIPAELDGLEFSAVLIDADHTGLFPTNDWLGVKDKVIPGGYVMFHDIHRKACYAALKMASETPGWKIVAEYSHIGHGFSTDRTMGTYGVVQKDK